MYRGENNRTVCRGIEHERQCKEKGGRRRVAICTRRTRPVVSFVVLK